MTNMSKQKDCKECKKHRSEEDRAFGEGCGYCDLKTILIIMLIFIVVITYIPDLLTFLERCSA